MTAVGETSEEVRELTAEETQAVAGGPKPPPWTPALVIYPSSNPPTPYRSSLREPPW